MYTHAYTILHVDMDAYMLNLYIYVYKYKWRILQVPDTPMANDLCDLDFPSMDAPSEVVATEAVALQNLFAILPYPASLVSAMHLVCAR